MTSSQLMDEIVIYENHPGKFKKRLWSRFSFFFSFYLLLLLFPLLNIHGNKAIIFSWIGIVTAMMIFFYFRYYKWTMKVITIIIVTGDSFEIELVEKNSKKKFTVKKDNIKTFLKWQRMGRPNILTLKIFDGNNKIIDLYSTGWKKDEYQLEEIAFQIKKYNTILTESSTNA